MTTDWPSSVPTEPGYTSLLGVPIEIVDRLGALNESAYSGEFDAVAEWVAQHHRLLCDYELPGDEELVALGEAMLDQLGWMGVRNPRTHFALKLHGQIDDLRPPHPLEELEVSERVYLSGGKRRPEHVDQQLRRRIMNLRRLLDLEYESSRSLGLTMQVATVAMAADWIDAQLKEDPQLSATQLQLHARTAATELATIRDAYDARQHRLPRL